MSLEKGHNLKKSVQAIYSYVVVCLKQKYDYSLFMLFQAKQSSSTSPSFRLSRLRTSYMSGQTIFMLRVMAGELYISKTSE